MIFTIRSQVLLLSLTLLSIPYVGYEYVREMERYLRDNLEISLQDTAKILANILNGRPLLFSRKLVDTVREDDPLFVHNLKTPIKLDDNIHDWRDILKLAENYAEKHILKIEEDYQPDSLSFRHLLGNYKGHYYALFIVQDNKIVYRRETDSGVKDVDHLQIVIRDLHQNYHRYLVAPFQPGWVTAYKERDSPYSLITENRIQGTFTETAEGYNLELRIPDNMIGDKLGFAIADVDDTLKRQVKIVIGTSPIQNLETVGKVFTPSSDIEQIIKASEETPGRRIWVLDKQRRVLAKTGELQRSLPQHPLNKFYSLLLPPPSEDFKDSQARAYRLEGQEVHDALKGKASVTWSSTPDEQAIIVSAAHPVKTEGQIVGVVVVQETSNRIQAIQRQAIASLYNKTLLIFLTVTLLLLTFASYLAVRLQRLRNQAESAIDANGRVTTTHLGSTAQDEIGQLSRTISNNLERLKQYNTYLEGMASRLSHELRTPIAVVRTSLENLEALHSAQDYPYECSNEESQTYLQRAKEGITRLNVLITRLTEATRLEQTLQSAEREQFDLTQLVKSCIASYRLVYPQYTIEDHLTPHTINLQGAPDLIAQMLDKLIANAVDFTQHNHPIIIRLTQQKHQAHLQITNYGKLLPSDIPQEQLFQTMVSLRPQTNNTEPHLGLGLYIVRLIANYHGGQVKASSDKKENATTFTVQLPIL